VIWDAESGDELQRFDGGSDVLTGLAFNGDSSIVAAGTASGPIRLFHLARLRDFRGRLTAIGFGSATDRVAGAFEEDPAAAARQSSRPDDHHSMLWSILDGSAVATFGDAVHETGDTVVAVGMSPDGRYVATGSRDKTASVWTADGRRVAGPLTATASPPKPCKGTHTDVVRAVAIDHDGDQPVVVTGGWDHVVNVWTLHDGAFGVVDCFELPDRVFAVTLSPDRRLVVAGGAGTGETGSRLLVRDIRDRKTLYKLELPDVRTVRTAWTIAYHPGTSRVVAGFEDGSLYMWNLHANTKANPGDNEGVTVYPEHVMLGHSTSIAQVAFNPSGTYVASASHDKSVRVWNVLTGGLELRLGGQSDAIVGVRFEPIETAERLFVVAADGSVRHQEFQWDRIMAMAHQRQRPLTDSECERYFPNSRCPAEIPRPAADTSR
jgi:WD40 repeat protein